MHCAPASTFQWPNLLISCEEYQKNGNVEAVAIVVARPFVVRDTPSSFSSCIYKIESTTTTNVPNTQASPRASRSGALRFKATRP